MRRSARFVARTISNQTILLPLLPGEQGMWVYEFNETAAYLWNQMAGDFTEGELLGKLATEFEIEQAAAALDVRTLVSDLLSLGAIE